MFLNKFIMSFPKIAPFILNSRKSSTRENPFLFHNGCFYVQTIKYVTI